MNKKTNIVIPTDIKELVKLLEKPTIVIAEVLTGILSYGLTEYKLVTGRLIQSIIKKNLLTQLGRELDDLKVKGKIKEDYFATHLEQASLYELLKFIDEVIPDEERFKAMKSIFFTTISIDADEIKQQIGYQLLQVVKNLQSMDLLVLKVCYEIYQKGDVRSTQIKSSGEWVNLVSDKIGYGLPQLVDQADERLVRLGLLSTRTFGDKSGVRAGREFRLTPLGITVCEYITNFSV
ncbi:hypothetical protein HYT02_05985 [Candidatus Gottesmanbacteria bacterium]|nr:hypothetical protein [Candidatus Gottesmanbacteria bacterium]